MKWTAWGLILGVLLATGPVNGEIIVNDQYAPHEPITASLKASLPEGADIDGRWDVQDGQSEPAGPGLKAIHVWAGPGSHRIDFQGVWLKTRETTIDGETVQILQGFGFIRESATFEVTEDDGPDPPPPPPEKRWGIIVEETADRTPTQASLWSRVTRATTLNQLMIVDQDSEAASLKPYLSAATEHVQAGGALPALVIVSSDDGSVVDVMECPETVATITQELGL